MIPFSDGERALLGPWTFDTEIDVYGVDDDTGEYTDLLRAALPATFASINASGAASGDDRASFLQRRVLRWERTYWMPEGNTAQVEDADGRRWNLQDGTYRSGPFYRAADVIRTGG